MKDKQLTTVVFPSILKYWDTKIVSLINNDTKFENIMIRDCSLHFSNETNEYYVIYNNIIFNWYNIYNYV